MSKLSLKTCSACRGDLPALNSEQISSLLLELKDWQVLDNHHLSKTYKFKDFAQALKWVNRVGDIAEEQQHHPNISFTWGVVKIEIWTHKVNGLTESDFILAAKIDRLESGEG